MFSSQQVLDFIQLIDAYIWSSSKIPESDFSGKKAKVRRIIPATQLTECHLGFHVINCRYGLNASTFCLKKPQNLNSLKGL